MKPKGTENQICNIQNVTRCKIIQQQWLSQNNSGDNDGICILSDETPNSLTSEELKIGLSQGQAAINIPASDVQTSPSISVTAPAETSVMTTIVTKTSDKDKCQTGWHYGGYNNKRRKCYCTHSLSTGIAIVNIHLQQNKVKSSNGKLSVFCCWQRIC